ncbi:hypothetical protein E2C01_045185 [Portunus trituberculatus]|uniref:Uncharacterized protein n=1 Tax=Portunus trituberculatus TaxID=210409 RepID=A0A5B7FU96_PORTR|nr:hypothetical protein [Portunus trituberculatus]
MKGNICSLPDMGGREGSGTAAGTEGDQKIALTFSAFKAAVSVEGLVSVLGARLAGSEELAPPCTASVVWWSAATLFTAWPRQRGEHPDGLMEGGEGQREKAEQRESGVACRRRQTSSPVLVLVAADYPERIVAIHYHYLELLCGRETPGLLDCRTAGLLGQPEEQPAASVVLRDPELS